MMLTPQQLAHYRALRRDAADAHRFPTFPRPASLDLTPRLRDDFGICHDARIDSIFVSGTGALIVEWSAT